MLFPPFLLSNFLVYLLFNLSVYEYNILVRGGHKMRGLFLGAGASYEVGMPLVWEFSQTLRENVLKRLETNLFDF